MAYDFEREMGIEERREAAELAQQGKVCPNCEEHGGVSTTWVEVTEAGVIYMAPFHRCGNCAFEYTDYEYEEAQERAFRTARRGN